jgi:heptosyltransferase-1
MNIAIVRLTALGDIIHCSIVLQFIKQNISNAKIDWIVDCKFKDILKDNKMIDNLIPIDVSGIKKEKSISYLLKQIKQIRSLKRYDIVIDMQGLLKSSIVTRLIKSKIRCGYDFDSAREPLASIFYNKKFNISYDMNTIDKNLLLVEKSLNISISNNSIKEKLPHIFYKNSSKKVSNILSDNQKNILFVIGSTWESRNYPKEKILNIIEELKENALILWGNSSEKQKANWITKNSKYAVVLPKLSLNQLKELISKIDLVIGNDTGPTHIAWAMNKPSITIFGPTPANRIHTTKINKLIKSDSKVDPKKLNKNDFSIKDIKEKKIINLANKLLVC